jgi:hypothetical protein
MMWMRKILALASAIIVAGAAPSANAGTSIAHHHRHVLRYQALPVAPAPRFGGRLVEHPAFNIACMTRDRATRALPCDQPVWVYGSPCEVDLGLGRYRSCD